MVPGNTHNSGNTDVTFSAPLFSTNVTGGWFKQGAHYCNTTAGFDPALALLVSHLLCTEYSVAEIVRDLMKNHRTPQAPHPPTFNNFGLMGRNPNFASSFNVNGVFSVQALR